MSKRAGFLIVAALLLVGSMLPMSADNVAADPAEAIIIDHTSANITQIPEWAIATAKARLHIGYGHASHGDQLTKGMTYLIPFANGGGKGLSLPTDIFAYNNGGTDGALDIEEGTWYTQPERNGWLWGTLDRYPEWRDETIEYLESDNHTDTNVIIWAWSYGFLDQLTDEEYLTPMAALSANYTDVTFVYMTAQMEHQYDALTKVANQMIRDYVNANGGVLYDFADIESWDPDGNPYEFPDEDGTYYSSATDNTSDGNWMLDWQNSHTLGVDWYDPPSPPHTQSLNVNLKAYAAWWLWARLAGWDGTNDQAIASYSDASHGTPSDVFDDFGTEHTVYMSGTGLLPNYNYRVAYYDGNDTRRVTDNVISNASGNISSEHEFDGGVDVAGTWNVIVYEPDFTPTDSYNGSWSYTIASDTFTVAESAIPEFPTVMAAIVAFSLCVGIYLWMRRKVVPSTVP